jgi:hypothetical protein
MKKWYLLIGLICVSAYACAIGFKERFALVDDRSEVLSELLPGGDDAFYYRALHALNRKNFVEYQTVMDSWQRERIHNWPPERARQLLNREALLRYENDPQRSLNYLRRQLDLRFNHTRKDDASAAELPAKLDRRLISREALLQKSLSEHPADVALIEPCGYHLLQNAALTNEQRFDLLKKLRHPDFNGLTNMIISDLRQRRGARFGELPIHSALTLAQIERLAAELPELRRSEIFVNACIARLAPLDEVNTNTEPIELDAYYQRVWKFAATLTPNFNSLKANLLYNWLRNDLKLGKLDKDHFKEYLKLPRRTAYAPKPLNSNNSQTLDFTRDFGTKWLPPIVDEKPLVHRILLKIFKDADDFSEFENLLKTEYLRSVFAEAKLTAGAGDPGQWRKWMSRSQYDELKRRVDVDFADDNPSVLAPTDSVTLSAYIKNVESLTVKVYELNTLNCYRDNPAPLNLAMNLNGLVATYEQIYKYNQPDILRTRHEFTFPELQQQRGAYIIELIGNGKSSRALIQQGHLKVVEEITAAGHAFSVYDENNVQLKDCDGWFNGALFRARDDGRIYIPFAADKKKAIRPFDSAALVVSNGGFATFKHFNHRPETYTLHTGFYVDREALIPGESAEVIVRPSLRINGCRTPLSLLKDVSLTLVAIDFDGVPSRSVTSIEKIDELAEYVHQFRVPERCAALKFNLEAKIENVALNEEQKLSAEKTFALNTGERRQFAVSRLLLRQHTDGYALEVRGKNGEPISGMAVHLNLKHSLFVREIQVDVKSDKNGIVRLGELNEISSVRASWGESDKRYRLWNLNVEGAAPFNNLHGRTDDVLRVPVSSDFNLNEDVSLLETRGGVYTANRQNALALKDGYLSLEGLPAGTYELFIKPENRTVTVRITTAENDGRFLISDRIMLEKPEFEPPIITSIIRSSNELTISLATTSPATRVHIVATRYLPEFNLFDALATPAEALTSATWTTPGSYYKSGRDIGDEHRYILERRNAHSYPGNMLERPGLLISPWARQESASEREELAEGGEYESAADKMPIATSRSSKVRDRVAHELQGASDSGCSCDFIAQPAVTLYNLKPDTNGVVRVSLNKLQGHPFVRIAAVNPGFFVIRESVLPAAKFATRERRLISALPHDHDFAESQQVAILQTGEQFEISSQRSAQYKIYDSVAKLYHLFVALSQDQTLREFAFITEWNRLPIKRKKELYSRYVCHELNLFLRFKDREFFNRVVKTFVANKRDKRFIDDWLLGNDLSKYMRGLTFARLNAAERALLAHEASGRKNLLARALREQVEVLPVDQERLNRLFETALQGGALNASTRQSVALMMRNRIDGPPDAAPALATFGGRRPLKSKAESAKALKKADVDDMMLRAGKSVITTDAHRTAELEARKQTRRLYQKLNNTREWAENNYYELPVEKQNAELIKPNLFWQEFAEHATLTNFLSGSVTLAANSFAEIMLALAVTDLPFQAQPHKEMTAKDKLSFTVNSPALVFYRRIQPADRAPSATALVAQSFFRMDDRYRYEGSQRFDKIVTDEFLKGVVYGARVVLTNPTEGRMKVRQLLQIPQGAVPIAGGFYTKGSFLSLEPYATETSEYHFYFPESGRYSHYPVTVASDAGVVAKADPLLFNVVDRLTAEDKNSWSWIAQYGTAEQVLEYLNVNNIYRVALDDIAWRMKELQLFTRIIDLLAERGVYNSTLWSYSIFHNTPAEIAEYLERSTLAGQCGLWLDAPLLRINPVQHEFYEHLEYAPLVNPRAHKVGVEHKILNTRFRANYEKFMEILAFKPQLEDEDELAVAWAMTLQDRVSEALEWFDRVERQHVAEQVQYDYLDAYLAFYRGDIKRARNIASGYEQYPVEKWRLKFESVLAQVGEIAGNVPAAAVDARSRDQVLALLAGTEPLLNMEIEKDIIKLKGVNVKLCELNFYPMDIEPLFSRAPFVEASSADFSTVRPALQQTVSIPNDDRWISVPLPSRFAKGNVMVEATAAGVRCAQACYANSIELQMVDRYGVLSVRHSESGALLPGVYVKVYARMNDGAISFYKDGYTDLRGRFDYASLNSNQIDNVAKFAVLVLSDDLGAVVRKASPPQKAQ